MKKIFSFLIIFLLFASLCFATNAVFYSLSLYGTGDIKTGSPTLTISSGVATLTVEQTNNIGVGCCIDFDPNNTLIYIAPNRLGFDSGGTTEIEVNTKIEDATSGATGLVRAIEVTSGAWASGDAAGYIYFSKITGTWGDDHQINRVKPSSSSDLATVNGTLQGNIGSGNTQFVVKQADGSDAANVGSSETVNSIHHEYASLSAYEAGFTDADHIADTDLTNADVVAYACCYYDHDDYTADTTALTINFGTIGASNYLHIFTPTGEAESINNQRHSGYWDTNKYRVEHNYTGISCAESYTRFEGLQHKFTNASVNSRSGFVFYDYNVIWDNIFIGNATSTGAIIGLYAWNTGFTDIQIYNNIIYDFINDSTSSYALYVIIDATNYVYNNTIHNCYYAINNNAPGKAFVVKNNLINDCNTNFLGADLSANSTHNVINGTISEGAFGVTYCSDTTDGDGSGIGKLIDTADGDFINDDIQVGSIVAYDAGPSYTYVTAIDSATQLSVDTGIGNGIVYTIYTNMYGSAIFKNEGGDNFHLDPTDTAANNKGINLSTDANLSIWDDIDSDERASDVGADEYLDVTPSPQLLTIQVN